MDISDFLSDFDSNDVESDYRFLTYIYTNCFTEPDSGHYSESSSDSE